MTTAAAPLAPQAVAYCALRASRSRTLTIRGLSYHLREWGSAEAPPLFLLHGARDSSASFQFLVDALDGDWRIIAPDWRGHGRTDWTTGSYSQADFLRDLDALRDELFPESSIPMVGHSMGAQIATLYAGLRPGRVERLAMLDALGNRLDESPPPIAQTLRNLLDAKTSAVKRRTYSTVEQMAERLMAGNRRLDARRAAFLAENHAVPLPGGGLVWPHDPSFQKSIPALRDTEEWSECWRRIEAPVLLLVSSDPRPNYATSQPEELRKRTRYFRDITVHRVPETGHNLHHDASEKLGRMLSAFLRGAPVRLE